VPAKTKNEEELAYENEAVVQHHVSSGNMDPATAVDFKYHCYGKPFFSNCNYLFHRFQA
jgi:hypothetical protein